MWRNAVAALILAAGAAAIWRVCVVPYRCSMVERQMDARTEEALRYPAASFAIREAARQRLAQLEECIASDPTNVNLYMLAAANARMVHNDEGAAALYERALQVDRRPEIYLNLGVVQAATNEPDKAVQSLVTAANFSGKDVLLDLPDVPTRMRAYSIVAANEARLLAQYGRVTRHNVVLNSTFDEAGPKFWTIGGSASATMEIVPSTRRRGGKMLHLVAAKGSWLQQFLGRHFDNVITDAWVFVRGGEIGVASGNPFLKSPDAATAAAGQWIRLQGRNGSCPVTEVRIMPVSGTADVFIDSVEMFEVPGPVCSNAR